jgi:hypothetical protein
VTNLQDYSNSDQRSFNAGISIDKHSSKVDNKTQVIGGNTTIGASHSGHAYAATTQATIGQGAIVTSNPNALDGVNRDINTATLVTKNQDTGGLNANVTVDNRLLTEAGRAEIAKEQKDLGKNIENTGKITAAVLVGAGSAAKGLLTGDQTLPQAVDTLLNSARAAQFIKDHPEQAAVLKAYQEGNYDGLPKTKEGLQQLANYLNVTVDVLLNNIGIKGITDSNTLISLDTDQNNRSSTVKVLGHEVAHNQGISSDGTANLVGSSIDWAVDAQTAAMDTIIARYEAGLGAGKDAATQAANVQLLLQDNTKLAVAIMAKPEQMENWGGVGHQATMQAGLYGGGMDPRKAKDLGIAAFNNDTNSKNAMSLTSILLGAIGKGDQIDRHLLDANVKIKELLDNLEAAQDSGDENKIAQARSALIGGAKQIAVDARNKAKADLSEVVSKTNQLVYGSAEYKAYVNSQEVKDKLHMAGDAFAHVDLNGEHYESFLGHLFDSVLGNSFLGNVNENDGSRTIPLLGTFSDPDNPYSNKDAYKEMTNMIYDVSVAATGQPNITKEKLNEIVSIVTKTDDEDKQLTALREGTLPGDSLVTEIPQDYGILGLPYAVHTVIDTGKTVINAIGGFISGLFIKPDKATTAEAGQLLPEPVANVNQ